MAQLTPELEALVASIIYLDCKVEAIMKVLQEEGIKLKNEDVDIMTRKIHGTQYEVKRHSVMCRITDSKFDIK
jgi:hypothetical protein